MLVRSYASIHETTKMTPGNIWFNQLDLGEGEMILVSYPANHSQGKRAVGGKIFVTNRRIAFVPNRLDALLWGRSIELPLAKVTSISTVPPRIRLGEIFSGALRSRLVIRGRVEDGDYFVVSNPQLTASQIEGSIKQAPV